MKTRTLVLITLCTLIAWTNAGALQSIATGDMTEGVAVNPITKIAVVTNMGSGTLSIIDLQTRQLTRTIEVGGTPVGPAIEPSRNQVVFSDKADNTMVIWDLRTGGGELARLSVGANPSCVALSDDIHVAVAASIGDNTVSVVNLLTRSVTHTIPVGPFPICMHDGVNPEDMTATVASAEDGTLQLLDIAEGTVLKTIPVGNFPVGPSRNLQTNQAIVPLNADNAAAIVDLTSGSVVHTVPLGLGPACSVIDEGTNIAYVSNLVEGSVSAVDMATGTELGRLSSLGEEPQCFALDASQNLVLVTSHSGEVWLIEADEIIRSSPLAVRPSMWGQIKSLLK